VTRRASCSPSQATTQAKRSLPVTEAIRDPVNRIRMAFEPDGETLIFHAWLEPGGGLPDTG
jgi:hypothetical protein